MISIQCKGYSLRITGHAGYAPAGQDIVCAAVTILSYALGGMLLRAESEGLLRAEPVVDMQPTEVHWEPVKWIQIWISILMIRQQALSVVIFHL